MIALLVVGGVFLGIFTVALVVALLCILFNLGDDATSQDVRYGASRVVGTSVVGLLVSLVLAGVGWAYATNNHFYNMNQDYWTSRANVVVLEDRMEDLRLDLGGYLEFSVDLDRSLAEAVTNRDIEGLRALFERYPLLRSHTNVKEVMGKIVSLRNDVARAEITTNEIAKAYNKAHLVRPVKWLAPDDLDDTLPLMPVGYPSVP